MADHKPATSFSRFITLLMFSLFVLTGLAAGASVGFDQSAVTLMPGEITTVNLTLDFAPDGFSGYRVLVSMADPTVGEIAAVTLPEWAEVSEITGSPGAEVTVMAVDLMENLQEGASGILLATISVKGLSPGTTEILLVDPAFANEDGFDFTPALSNVSITVVTDASTLPATTTTTTTTTSPVPDTTTATATATTIGSVATGGSGGGGSGGGSSSVSAPAVTTASGTPGPETSPTIEQPTEQMAETTPVMTSPSVPSIPTGETTSPSPAGQGIPFLSAPGIMVLVYSLILLGRKMR